MLRHSLNIKINDSVEILTDDNMIILRKFETGDIFTGNMENLIEFKGKLISKDTIVELAGIAGLGVYKIKR